MKNRIKQFIASQNRLSEAQFEREVGLSQGAIQKFGEGTRPSTLDKISSVYPQLNISWLRTGEGEMLHSSMGNSFDELQKNSNNITVLTRIIEQQSRTIEFLQEQIRKKDNIEEKLRQEIEQLNQNKKNRCSFCFK